MKTLLIGGARSGKSRLAERLAIESGAEVRVFVTAESGMGDVEMDARIAAHQSQRPVAWQVIETPRALASALAANDAPGRCLVVDCLTLWLSNLLHDGRPQAWTLERDALLSTLPRLQAELILIGNEVGHGIVPMGELSRRFVDESGRLHQDLAQRCERVRFVVAGCAMALKG